MKQQNPLDLARAAAADYQACYGSDLESVVVFGSATSGEFDPKSSDINLLIVLRRISLESVARSLSIQEKWLKRRFSRPMFMDPEYIERSLDSFPIEFLNIRENSLLLYGRDLLSGLDIRLAHLRLQVERELKGKWLHLLSGWLDAGGRTGPLKQLLHLSIKDFSASFKALLAIKGLPIPKERPALFKAIGEAYGISEDTFEQVLVALHSGDKERIRSIFPAYSRDIKKLIDTIDHMEEKHERNE